MPVKEKRMEFDQMNFVNVISKKIKKKKCLKHTEITRKSLRGLNMRNH